MPVYQPGIPTGTVNLDVDYLNLQGNFSQANIVYGTDHYPFDNATPNQGFHNLVTTPPVVNNPPDSLPPATAANPKFYAFEQYSAIGVIQYSRGTANAVPTPVTHLNSPSTPLGIPQGGVITVLDFTGMTLAICNLYAADFGLATRRVSAYVVWNGSVLTVNNLNSGGALSAIAGGPFGRSLQLFNNSASGNFTQTFWTLVLERVQ